MNSIRGIDNHERLDEELYQDFETDEARKVSCWCSDSSAPTMHSLCQSTPCHSVQKRLAKEAKDLEKLEKTSMQVPARLSLPFRQLAIVCSLSGRSLPKSVNGISVMSQDMSVIAPSSGTHYTSNMVCGVHAN